MRSEKLWAWMYVVVVSISSTVAMFLARSTSTLDEWVNAGYLGVNFDVTLAKDVLLIAGLTIWAAAVGVPYAVNKLQLKALTRERDSALEYTKEAFTQSFNEIIQQIAHFNVRLFVPDKHWKHRLNKLYNILFNKDLSIQKEFVVRNVEGLSKPGNTSGLKYLVDPPEYQGLVGKCYNTRKWEWDDNLRSVEADRENPHNLTEFQRSVTCDHAFCMVVPLFNAQGNVVAIVSMDSTLPLNFTGFDESTLKYLEEFVTSYARTLYNYFPSIFNYEMEGFYGSHYCSRARAETKKSIHG